MLPRSLIQWLQDNNCGEITSYRSVGSGFSTIQKLDTTSGKTFFLKQYPFAPKTTAYCEAQGLLALRDPKTIKVPEPYHWTDDYLLLEYIQTGHPNKDFAETFGRQLAQLHKTINPKFGFEHDNFIGATPQINSWESNGHTFFKRHRLQYQFNLADKKNHFDHQDKARFEKILSKLESLIPTQPASLIHGDLWNGNVLTDQHGDPVLIDPAVHYGWAEAELAMTIMFGGFGDEFFAAYQEINPLESGWQNRLPLYNLYHYLNHLNLFGTSYLNSVRSILRKYS